MGRRPVGFTMIELVVTVGILVLLSGGAIVTYVDFRDRKQALADVRLIWDHLKKVRTKSMAVEVPTGKLGVVNYEVVVGSDAIHTNVIVSDGTVADYVPVLNFSDGTEISSSVNPINFLAGSGSADGGAEITVCGINKFKYTIDINTIGIVSDPVYVSTGEGCP